MKRIASFDIGVYTFSILIESFDETIISSLPSLTNKRFNSDGTPTDLYKEVLDRIYLQGRILYRKTIDISDSGSSVTNFTLLKLTEYLDSILNILEICDMILIEKQMDFSYKNKMVKNKNAIRIENHLSSYLLISKIEPNRIILYPASNKTKILGCPNDRRKKKNERKKWSSEITCYILSLRGDSYNLDYVNSLEKKDDISDCLLQLQSAKYLYFCKGKRGKTISPLDGYKFRDNIVILDREQ